MYGRWLNEAPFGTLTPRYFVIKYLHNDNYVCVLFSDVVKYLSVFTFYDNASSDK